MRAFIGIFILFLTKLFSCMLFKTHSGLVGESSEMTNEESWQDIRLCVFLNHTSLFEPLFTAAIPNSFLWKLGKHMVAPGADTTLKRPIVGTFYSLMSPGMKSISRKRDQSWTTFLDSIEDDSIIVIAPEGRMMRKNGLDKNGKPMSVRGGIADILMGIDSGKMLLAYSGGLHHVQTPGEFAFRPFQTIKVNREVLDIADYKKALSTEKNFKLAVVKDLEKRMKIHCPI